MVAAMVTKHDRKQDVRIDANEEAIRRQTEYLREIRNHFCPEAEQARYKRLVKAVTIPIIKVIAVTAFIGGMWDVVVWLENKYDLKTMSRRYAEVAKSIYYGENNPEVAGQFLDKAIELQGANAEYRFLRAYMQGMAATRKLLNLDRPFTKEELDQAHAAYAEALFLQGLRPKRAEPYVLKAQILAALKETERAENALNRALELDGTNAFVHLRLAQVRMDRKDADGAEKALADALRLDPESKWVWLWKGIFARESKRDVEGARNCYGKALAIAPKFDMAWYNMAWTWMDAKSRDYPKAREALQKALALNPDYKEACYAMGMTYGYEDNYPVAKIWMDKAVALDGSFLTAIKWRGIVSGEMGDHAGAVADFDRAILLDPANADLYVRRAKAEEKLGRAGDALRDLRFALDLKPDAKRTWMYLGDVLLSAGNPEGALESFAKAVEIDPDYDDALGRMASALDVLGDRNAALEKMDAAIAAAKLNPKLFWLQKADLLESWGRLAEAAACCEKAHALDPDFAAAWKKEAEIRKALSDREGCLRALETYLEIVPTDSSMREELRIMQASGLGTSR
jgi:tetratricopeptide (TPR) repeat protein